MKKRNPFGVFAYPFLTFGIYSLYWQVVTKGELNSKGAQIPTAWLIIVPFVNLWWLWKYCEGVEQVAGMSGPVAFLLLFFLGPIGSAIIQDKFNAVADGGTPVDTTPRPDPMPPVPPASPEPPVAPTPPTATPQV